MPRSYYYQRPIPWEDVERLLEELSEEVDKTNNIYLCATQTAIALGCYLGPKPAELLSITWHHIEKGAYYFRNEAHRQPLRLEQPLSEIIKRNREIIKPSNPNYNVLIDPLKSPFEPLSVYQFNKKLSNTFKKYGIDTPEPKVETLRKTFARKMWQDLGCTDEVLTLLSEQLKVDQRAMKNYVSY